MDGCDGKHDSRGLCKKHYNRHYKAGTLPPLAPRRPTASAVCAVDDCVKPAAQRAYCWMHYYRMRRHGSLEKPQNRKFCTAEGCDGPAFGLGLCQSHYLFKRRHDPDRPRCAEGGCTRASVTRGYCGYHYAVNCLPEWVDQYRRSPEVRERIAQWRDANPDRMLELGRRWKLENPELVREASRRHSAKRRARMYGSAFETVDFRAILDDHGMVCHICGGDIESDADLHFDHVIPLAKGGPHVAENIRPSHSLCNRRKGARLSA